LTTRHQLTNKTSTVAALEWIPCASDVPVVIQGTFAPISVPTIETTEKKRLADLHQACENDAKRNFEQGHVFFSTS